jgi:hypothetical protein
MLPDELQHQQLIKIRVEQGSRNRVQLPVMVMRAPRQVDNHNGFTLLHHALLQKAGILTRNEVMVQDPLFAHFSTTSGSL